MSPRIYLGTVTKKGDSVFSPEDGAAYASLRERQRNLVVLMSEAVFGPSDKKFMLIFNMYGEPTDEIKESLGYMGDVAFKMVLDLD